MVSNKCKLCGCGPDVHWHADVRHKYVEVDKVIDVDEVVKRYERAYGQVVSYEQALGAKKQEIAVSPPIAAPQHCTDDNEDD